MNERANECYSVGDALEVIVARKPNQRFVTNIPEVVEQYLKSCPWQQVTVRAVCFRGRQPLPVGSPDVSRLVGIYTYQRGRGMVRTPN